MVLASSDFFPASQQPGLFRSDAWLTAWHDTWGRHPALLMPEKTTSATAQDLRHMILRVSSRRKKILSVVNAFPPGLSSSSTPSVRSEYFFLEREEGDLADTIRRWLDAAQCYSWDQLYIADVLRSSLTYTLLLEEAQRRGLEVIHQNIESTYAIDLRHQGFEDYLQSRGKNTRLKLFNRRRNLAQLGKVEVNNIWPNRAGFFELLDQFHQARWGKPCYREGNRKFINRLLDNLDQEGHPVDFSVLTLAGKPLSAVFDISYQGRKYNLQTGYQENFHKSISLGTLHFGYQIEAAFRDPDVAFYDFMAGKGKNSDYKKCLANCSDEFATLLRVRSPLLRLYYRARHLCCGSQRG